MSKNNKKSKGGRGKKSKVLLPFPNKYATVHSLPRTIPSPKASSKTAYTKTATGRSRHRGGAEIMYSFVLYDHPPTFFYFLSVLSIQVRVYSLFLQRTVQNRGILCDKIWFLCTFLLRATFIMQTCSCIQRGHFCSKVNFFLHPYTPS